MFKAQNSKEVLKFGFIEISLINYEAVSDEIY